MSMKHPEAGDILALLDGETGDDTERLRAHVDECAACRDVRDGLQEARGAWSAAVATLVPPEADVERALASVKTARSADRRSGDVRWRVPLARAAAVILAFGVLASGLPGSPVRAWLQDRLGPADPPAPDVTAIADPGDPGVRVAPSGGRARISVDGLSTGGQVTVRVAEGELLSVFASDGATFATDAGRVRVGNAGARVTVELPPSLEDAIVEVGGQVVYRKVGNAVETPLGSMAHDGGEVRIRP